MKKFFVVVLGTIFALPLCLLGGCGKQEAPKVYYLSIEDDVKFVSIGKSYEFFVEDQAGITCEDFVLKCNEEGVEVDGHTLTINSDATAEQSVEVFATVDDVKTQTLNLVVMHVEAKNVLLNISASSVFAGGSVSLTANKMPANATREISYKIVSGQNYATLNNNVLSVSENAPANATIVVVAACGEVKSAQKTITVKEEVSSSDVLAVEFDSATKTLDSSISSTLKLFATLAVANADNAESAKIVYSIVSGGEFVDFYFTNGSQFATLTAKADGEVVVKAQYGNYFDTITIDVIVAPTLVVLPDSFDGEINYCYAKNNAIENVVPSFGTQTNASKNYSVFVENESGTVVASWNVVENVSTQVTSTISSSYENGNLTINEEGNYKVYFKSFSGASAEKDSLKFNLTINNGQNISSVADLERLFVNGTSSLVLNLENDILITVLKQYNHKGNLAIFGNGYTFDVSGVPLKIYEKAHWTNLFNISYKDANTNLKLELKDVSFNGNSGNLSAKQFADKIGVGEQVVLDLDKDQTLSFTYENMIKIENIDDTKLYPYCVTDINNVSLTNLTRGFRIGNVNNYDSQGNLIADIQNLSCENIFGEALWLKNPIAHADNLYINNVIVPINTMYEVNCPAEETKTFFKLQLGNNITLKNLNAGDSLHISKVLFSDKEEVSEMLKQFGGLTGIVNAAMNLKVGQLEEQYKGYANEKEIYANINAAITHFFKLIGDENQYEMLGIVENSANEPTLESYTIYDNELVLTNETFIKPINTEKEYIILDLREMVAGLIEDYDGGVFMQYLDEIKYRIVLKNLNYIAD